MLALDCASSEYFKNGGYEMKGEGKSLDADGNVRYLADLVARYPIVSIEDGMAEGDRDGWKALPTKSATNANWSATIFSSPITSASPTALPVGSAMPLW